jgi:hypothetical protein
MQINHPWGNLCQEGMVGWPGDPVWLPGWCGTVVLAFLAVAGSVPPRGRGASWSALSVSARQGAGEDERA